ncbi:hypothetical protein [Halobacillus litoralis]|uniref:Uncharacterized protein n=1 Tax=Halobacillus litoralis TaxID=45668 RepID=A0A410M9B0_9BACI|nr:hypothetical protein [Halobacillus litoralis]QAS51277.1 hypothetical protein HLI_03135 [Halobacillus litoralis]
MNYKRESPEITRDDSDIHRQYQTDTKAHGGARAPRFQRYEEAELNDKIVRLGFFFDASLRKLQFFSSLSKKAV